MTAEAAKRITHGLSRPSTATRDCAEGCRDSSQQTETSWLLRREELPPAAVYFNSIETDRQAQAQLKSPLKVSKDRGVAPFVLLPLFR